MRNLPNLICRMILGAESDYYDSLGIDKNRLTELSLSNDVGIRRNVAENPHTPFPVLFKMTSDSDKEVLERLARNTTNSYKILEKLLEIGMSDQKKYDNLLRNIARNKKSSEKIFNKLLTITDEKIKTEVSRIIAFNKELPVSTLIELAKSESKDVLVALAYNPNIPKSVELQLAKSKITLVRAGIAQTSNNVYILGLLLNDTNENVRLALAINEHLPPDMVKQLATDKSEDIATQIAKTCKDESILMSFVNRSDKVKEAIASNESASENVLRIMYKPNLNEGIKIRLSINPNTPSNVLLKLTQVPSFIIKTNIIKHPKCNFKIIDILSDSSDRKLRCIIAKTTGYPEIMDKLVMDKDVKVRFSLASNPLLLIDYVRTLAIDPDQTIQMAVATRKILTEDVIIRLSKSEHELVLKEVLDRKETPSDIRQQIKTKLQLTFKSDLPGRKLGGKFFSNDLYLLYIKTRNKEELTPNEIKGEPFYNSKDVQAFIKYTNGKKFNTKMIIDFDKSLLKDIDAMTFIKKYSKLEKSFWTGSQRIFSDSKKNQVMLLNIPSKYIDNFKEIVSLTSIDSDKWEMLRNSNHPFSKIDYTLGWIRFTVFGDKIWIDELQSDLFKVMSKEFIENIKGLLDYLLHRFIQLAHKVYGAKTIYMPGIEIKRALYKSDPPISIYRDIPKKARFKEVELKEVKLNELDSNIPKINPNFEDLGVWVLNATVKVRRIYV